LRLAEAEPWNRVEQMNAERENFGFHLKEHPVEQYRAVASANGAMSYASLMESGVPGGGRRQAMMAALVEGMNRGKTRRGADFVRADFSDNSGRFSAACFEESLVEPFQRWAAEGTCVLLTVELDAPSPDEPPRVTVRGARPLAEVSSNTSMLLTLEASEPAALAALRLLLAPSDRGTGEVLARLHTGESRDPLVRLGANFELDGELAERIQEIPGVTQVSLRVKPQGANLRLVA
jgi:DNA polymerase-3 subunit alpha